MKQERTKILSNKKVADGRFQMRLEAPGICKSAKAGQFVMVKCSKSIPPLLRRPLSFHKIENKHFELLYQVIGKGTKALSQRKKGERLDVIGPLGNGFDVQHTAYSTLNAILIGGGIGVAPLLGLGRQLKARGLPFTVLLGVRTKSHILCEKEFKKLRAKIKIATEDGSKGHKGFATDLLKKKLKTKTYELGTTVYACGPRKMLKATAAIARSKNIPCQVSFEERMACGTGVCLGCAVKTAGGFKMVCKDGPIFNAGDIVW